MDLFPTATDVELTCPVCQAVQPADDACRRCRADLRAVIVVRRNVALAALSTLVHTMSGKASQATAAQDRLHWLSPKMAAPLARLRQ